MYAPRHDGVVKFYPPQSTPGKPYNINKKKIKIMTKEELLAAAAAGAAVVFSSTKIFVPTGWSGGDPLADDANVSRLAQIEAGKSYLIFSVDSASTVETLKPEEIAAGKKAREGRSVALNLLETESGAPARIYLGTLQRNMIAATKNGFNGTIGSIKSKKDKFLTISQYDRGELKSDGSRDIKINYSVVDNI